jgi:hypothetical protein
MYRNRQVPALLAGDPPGPKRVSTTSASEKSMPHEEGKVSAIVQSRGFFWKGRTQTRKNGKGRIKKEAHYQMNIRARDD